jgi:DNA-binding MarR family transcriptional regulator
VTRVPDVAALASELRLAVHRLTRRLRQMNPEQEMTLTQLSALAVVWREGPMSAGELAAKERVKPPSITRVVTGLEEIGMLRRSEHPTDGRQVLITITEAGQEAMERAVAARELWLGQQIATLTAHERAVLHEASELLVRLAAR